MKIKLQTGLTSRRDTKAHFYSQEPQQCRLTHRAPSRLRYFGSQCKHLQLLQHIWHRSCHKTYQPSDQAPRQAAQLSDRGDRVYRLFIAISISAQVLRNVDYNEILTAFWLLSQNVANVVLGVGAEDISQALSSFLSLGIKAVATARFFTMTDEINSGVGDSSRSNRGQEANI